ncbi:Mitochondrial intermembrane space cysteine motif-containing protein MIX17 [Cladobotryum mycophilum]|uniref:Mitochondrial intermembrane space cysteine motif-containing protein MIX17 n=1 Tax=Cladobotryum mycophilum TaxID=491253 RepID=A0ABR0T386_9HYPO
MPRQRSVGRAPSRPTAAAPKPALAPQQQRPATTYAAPPQHAPAPAAPVSQGPGLFGQMASTAAGVAVGSAMGNALSGMFSGGSSEPAAPVQAEASPQQNQYASANCAGAAESFTKCLDTNNGDMAICNWYLEQLKACQTAARPY